MTSRRRRTADASATGRLTHRVIADLLTPGQVRPDRTWAEALATTDDRMRRDGYYDRAARQRICGAALQYLSSAPPDPWIFLEAEARLPGVRLDLVWWHPTSTCLLIDEVKTGQSGVDLSSTREQADRYLQALLANGMAARLVVVRIVGTRATSSSTVVHGGGLTSSKGAFARGPPMGLARQWVPAARGLLRPTVADMTSTTVRPRTLARLCHAVISDLAMGRTPPDARAILTATRRRIGSQATIPAQVRGQLVAGVAAAYFRHYAPGDPWRFISPDLMLQEPASLLIWRDPAGSLIADTVLATHSPTDREIAAAALALAANAEVLGGGHDVQSRILVPRSPERSCILRPRSADRPLNRSAA